MALLAVALSEEGIHCYVHALTLLMAKRLCKFIALDEYMVYVFQISSRQR
jgi:hypothetical protein